MRKILIIVLMAAMHHGINAQQDTGRSKWNVGFSFAPCYNLKTMNPEGFYFRYKYVKDKMIKGLEWYKKASDSALKMENSYIWGISFTKKLNKHFYFETGLEYYRLQYSINNVKYLGDNQLMNDFPEVRDYRFPYLHIQDTIWPDLTFSQHYKYDIFRIPLLYKYNYDYKRLRLGMSAGVFLFVPYLSTISYTETYKLNGIDYYNKYNYKVLYYYNSATPSLDLKLSAEIGYKINSNAYVALSPVYYDTRGLVNLISGYNYINLYQFGVGVHAYYTPQEATMQLLNPAVYVKKGVKKLKETVNERPWYVGIFYTQEVNNLYRKNIKETYFNYYNPAYIGEKNGFNTGIQLRKKIGWGFYIETGLGFNNNGWHRKRGPICLRDPNTNREKKCLPLGSMPVLTGVTEGEGFYNYYYISIPLMLEFNVKLTDKSGLYVKGGISKNRRFIDEYKGRQYLEDYLYFENTTRYFYKWGEKFWENGIAGSIGYSYEIYKNYSICVEPSFRYSSDRLEDQEQINNLYSYGVGVHILRKLGR